MLVAGGVGATVAYTSARSDLQELRISLDRQERLTGQAEDRSERYLSDVDEIRERLRELRARLEREMRGHARLTRRFHEFFCFPGQPPGAFYRPPRRADVTGDGSVDVVRLVGLPGPPESVGTSFTFGRPKVENTRRFTAPPVATRRSLPLCCSQSSTAAADGRSSCRPGKGPTRLTASSSHSPLAIWNGSRAWAGVSGYSVPARATAAASIARRAGLWFGRAGVTP